MKVKVKMNPAKKRIKKKTSGKVSSTRTKDGKYIHRPKVVTSKSQLTTTKLADGKYKFNPVIDFSKGEIKIIVTLFNYVLSDNELLISTINQIGRAHV